MFHLDVSLRAHEDVRCFTKLSRRTHWGNVDGMNICAGSFTNFIFDKKVSKGFNPKFKKNVMIVQDPLIKLYHVWNFVFKKEVFIITKPLIGYKS